MFLLTVPILVFFAPFTQLNMYLKMYVLDKVKIHLLQQKLPAESYSGHITLIHIIIANYFLLEISGSHSSKHEDTSFWDIVPCYLIEVSEVKEAVGTSEMSLYFNKTTQRYIPEGCNFISFLHCLHPLWS
jgi:hypothetical protein